MILLTGATGMVGAHLAKALVEKGYTVRCLVRNKEKLGALNPKGCLLQQGDLANPETLDAALQGCDIVVHTAGIVSYWNRKRAQLQTINVEKSHS